MGIKNFLLPFRSPLIHNKYAVRNIQNINGIVMWSRNAPNVTIFKFILWWVITIPVLIAIPHRIIIFTVAENSVCFSKDTPIILFYLWVLVFSVFFGVNWLFLCFYFYELTNFEHVYWIYSMNKVSFYLKTQLPFMMQCYHRNGRKQWFLRNVGTSNRCNVCYVILLTQLILSITRGYAIGEFAYCIIHIRCVISSHIFHKQESIMQNFGCFYKNGKIIFFVSRCLDRLILEK